MVRQNYGKGKFLVSLFSALLAIPAAVGLFSCVLLVIFGQITVRKLRKNPETKQELGIEFLSGWDIFNVAQALSIPKAVAKKIRDNSMGSLHANPDLLYKHTTVFDRVLARLFYWLALSSISAMFILIILDEFGVFG